MIFAILIGGYYFVMSAMLDLGRGGIAEKYISHYGIGMEAEYGDRNHCGNCRRNFAGTGTIFSVSAAYDRRFFSADGDICLCGQGRGAKGAAAL